MRKRESLYLHALFALVREEFEHDRDLATEAFEEYETMDVSPTAVHRSKAVHERAVFALADELSSVVASDVDAVGESRRNAGEETDRYAE
ncbi:UPF0058 family protein [Halosimplex salinum]|uniref:UPF0058 family protein n=1 Tax=Halosimplex salinum TaxID=1710538 RepID=UPI000F49FF7D|nr:UPF0058 family protein [Halosimplex salinum]